MLTVLTPAYNRAYIMHNAYESLKRQSCFDFEWIIVDDGSSDNTEELCQKWIAEENEFSIKYYKQQNGGKHRAVNFGVSVSNGEYILILDSDDYLTDNAVERIMYWLGTIKDKADIAGVVGLRGHEDGTALGNALPSEYLDITSLQRKKYGLMSDKAEVYSKEIMTKYPFPEFEGEKFLGEAASWDRIARDGHKLRYFNEIIYMCEYIEDGLTKNLTNLTYAKNFQGFVYNSKLYMETSRFPFTYFKLGHILEVAKLAGLKAGDVCRILEVSPVKLFLGSLLFKVKNIIKKMIRKIK